MRVGPFTVAVTEVPARSLTEAEWCDIQLARRSYPSMWGGDASDILTDDPVDGRCSPLYDTKHYIAWVSDGDEPCKLVTMRKAALVPSQLTERQRADPFELLPPDLQFWSVRADGGGSVRLWDVVRDHARRLAPHDPFAEFRVASTGRTGTFPYGERRRTPREKERTAIAFAAIQLLAAYGDPSLLYVCSLCPEFQDRVLGVVDVDGVYVRPAFTRTEEVLGLPPGSVGLDDGLQVVRRHKARFPGYFLDNDDAARVVAALLDEGRITTADLGATFVRLAEQENVAGSHGRHLEELAALVATRDHRRLAEILTRPHLFKYLVPLMAPEMPLARVLCEAGDGPFSSTLVPGRWATSAWAILEAAEAKYAAVDPGPDWLEERGHPARESERPLSPAAQPPAGSPPRPAPRVGARSWRPRSTSAAPAGRPAAHASGRTVPTR
jgi:hypothetical protein